MGVHLQRNLQEVSLPEVTSSQPTLRPQRHLRQYHPTSTHSSHSASSSSAFKLSHPNRKYFDSGDYELARAGILSSASVGSIHPPPINCNTLYRQRPGLVMRWQL